MTDDELKQFKASLSITAVAQALGIKVERGKFKCFCPQRHVHGDRTPSVSISEERGMFRCWVCDDVRGDVFSLVQQYRVCSFPEALNFLKEMFPFLVPGNRRSVSQSPSISSTTLQPVIPRSEQRNVAPVPEREIPQEPPKALIPDDERKKVVLSFLKMLSPIEGTPAAAYLTKRRIYKPVWDRMLLRCITDYDSLNRHLKETFSMDVLRYVGLFNDRGNLRYYKHPLIFPYLDTQNRAFHFQARAIDRTVEPKELHLKGTVPFPYTKSRTRLPPPFRYAREADATWQDRSVPRRTRP